MLGGSIVALVTPFSKGEVDYRKIEELLDYHIQNHTQGIVIIGTTGEAPVLSPSERYKIIKTACKIVNHKIPLIVGTGTNDTKTTNEYTKMATELGADFALVVTPYYNKPSQEGLYLHYKTIAKNNKIPLIIYNVPSRTGVSISPETISRLSEIKNIVAIKEASGSLKQVKEIISTCNIAVISGNDSLAVETFRLGGKGVISVAANIIPKEMFELSQSCKNNNYKSANKIHNKYLELFNILFIETNPIPIKTAMNLIGMIHCEFRLPLCPMAKSNLQKLIQILKKYNFALLNEVNVA